MLKVVVGGWSLGKGRGGDGELARRKAREWRKTIVVVAHRMIFQWLTGLECEYTREGRFKEVKERVKKGPKRGRPEAREDVVWAEATTRLELKLSPFRSQERLLESIKTQEP